MCSAWQLVNKRVVPNMVQGMYNIKTNMLSWSQDNTNVQTTTFGDYKTEDYKRSEMAVVLNVTNYFGQQTISAKYVGCPLQNLIQVLWIINNTYQITYHLSQIK